MASILVRLKWRKSTPAAPNHHSKIFRHGISVIKPINSTFYGASMDVGYYVTPNAKVFTEVSYNHYSEGKGGSQMIDHSDNSYDEQGGDAAGIANKNYSISAGLAYRF